MINREDYGSGMRRPALKAAMLGKANLAIGTIASVEPNVEIPDPEREGGKRTVLVLTFNEFVDQSTGELLAYYPNATSIDYLIESFGNNEAKWIGQRVPLEKVKTTNPRTKLPTEALWVAPTDQWKTLLKKGSARGAASRRR